MSSTNTMPSAGIDTARVQSAGWDTHEDFCAIMYREGTPEYCECRSDDPNPCDCGSWDSALCSCQCDICYVGCGTAQLDPDDPYGPCVNICDTCDCHNGAHAVGGGVDQCSCDCTGICKNGGSPNEYCDCDCTSVIHPEHSSFVGNVCEWVCDPGFTKVGEACVAVTPGTPCGCGGTYDDKGNCTGQSVIPGTICGTGKIWKDCDTCACIDGFESCGDGCYQSGTEGWCRNCAGGCWEAKEGVPGGGICHKDDEYACTHCEDGGCWINGICRYVGGTCGCNNEGEIQADCSCSKPAVGDSCKGKCTDGTIQDDCSCSAKNPGDSCTGPHGSGTYDENCVCQDCPEGKVLCTDGNCYDYPSQEYCEHCVTGGHWCPTNNTCFTSEEAFCEGCVEGGQWCAETSSCDIGEEAFCENCMHGTWCERLGDCSLTAQSHCEDCLEGCWEDGNCILEEDDPEVYCACRGLYWCETNHTCYRTFKERCENCNGGCYSPASEGKAEACYETEGEEKCKCKKMYWCDTITPIHPEASCVEDEDACCLLVKDSQEGCENVCHDKWCKEKNRCFAAGEEHCKECYGGCFDDDTEKYGGEGFCWKSDAELSKGRCECEGKTWCARKPEGKRCVEDPAECCGEGEKWCELKKRCFSEGMEYCDRCKADDAPAKFWCPECKSDPCKNSEQECCECQSGKRACVKDGVYKGCYRVGKQDCEQCEGGCYKDGDCITDERRKCEKCSHGKWCQGACRVTKEAQCMYCNAGDPCYVRDNSGDQRCVDLSDKKADRTCDLVEKDDGYVTDECNCKCNDENASCMPLGCSAEDDYCYGHKDDKCVCICDRWGDPCNYKEQGPESGKLNWACKCVCKDEGKACTPDKADGEYGKYDDDCKCKCAIDTVCTDYAGRQGKVVEENGVCTCKCDAENEKAACEDKIEVNDNWAWVDQACECKCVKANQTCQYNDAHGKPQWGYVDPDTCECGQCKKDCKSPAVLNDYCECECPAELGECPPGRHRSPEQSCKCVCDEDGSGCDKEIQTYDKVNCKCKCNKGGEKVSIKGKCYEYDEETCNLKDYDPGCESPRKQDEHCGCDACIGDEDCPTVGEKKWHRSLEKDCACTGCDDGLPKCNEEQYRSEDDCECHCIDPNKCGRYGDIQKDCSCNCWSLERMGGPYGNGGYWEVTDDCQPYCPATADSNCSSRQHLNLATCKCECNPCDDPAKPDQKDNCECYCDKDNRGGADCDWDDKTCSCKGCSNPCKAEDCSCNEGCEVCVGCKTKKDCHCVADPNGSWYRARDAAANNAATNLANAEQILKSVGNTAPIPYSIYCSCCMDMACLEECDAVARDLDKTYKDAASKFSTARKSAQATVNSMKDCVNGFNKLKCGSALPTCTGDLSGLSDAYEDVMAAYADCQQAYAKYDGC